MSDTVEGRLKALDIRLPNAAAPAANYVPFVQSGNLLFVSGQVPVGPNGVEFVGKLGADCSLEDGQAAARLCAINIIAQIKAATGDLEKVRRIVKLGGFVNATDDFTDHPKVINGASDLMAAVFDEKGAHARAAVGVSGLPFGVAAEVEAIIELED